MDDKLASVLIYSRPIPLKYVHSKLTSKLGTLRARRLRMKTESSSRLQSSHTITFQSPSHKQIRQKTAVFSPFSHSSDVCESTNAFNSKLFRERCENIKNKQKRKKEVCFTEGLPALSPKLIHRTTAGNFRTLELNLSSSMSIHDPPEHSNHNGQLSSQKGTVLTLDISSLPQQYDRPPKILRRKFNIDNTLCRLENLRKQNLKSELTPKSRGDKQFQDFELRPWDSKEDLQLF